jgi:hypothetical protein
LAQGDAVWKDAAEATKEIFQYSVHRGRRRDYTGSERESCEEISEILWWCLNTKARANSSPAVAGSE